jgi:hypothetical protein
VDSTNYSDAEGLKEILTCADARGEDLGVDPIEHIKKAAVLSRM